MLAGCLNSFPNSIFAQNNGMIQLTGVASRYVGYFIALFLVVLGMFPAVGKIFALIPDPVLGGATLLMFGTVAAAGIRIISTQKMNRKAILVMALSFSFGLSVELVPEILSKFPQEISTLFSSGITTGGIVAILSNMLIRIKEQRFSLYSSNGTNWCRFYIARGQLKLRLNLNFRLFRILQQQLQGLAFLVAALSLKSFSLQKQNNLNSFQQ